MARPPVYEDGLFELSIDPSWNSLDNTFKHVMGVHESFIKYAQLSMPTWNRYSVLYYPSGNFSCFIKKPLTVVARYM